MALRLDPADPAQNAHVLHDIPSPAVSYVCESFIAFVHPLPTAPSIRAVGEDLLDGKSEGLSDGLLEWFVDGDFEGFFDSRK